MTFAAEVYLWVMVIAYTFTLLYDLYRLAQAEYPRIESRGPGDDVAGVVISGGMLVWVILLLA